MQQIEVQSSLIQQINEAHADCLASSENVCAAVIRACNRARECGDWLKQLKEANKGRFQAMFANRGPESETRFTFTYETAHNYIKFATANPEEITQLSEGVSSLRKAMEAVGALPARTHEGQSGHTNESNFFISAGKQLMAFSTLWEKQMDHHPVSEWSKETAEQFVGQMEPIIENVNTIYAQAKERALAHAA